MEILSWIGAAVFCWPGAPCTKPQVETVPTAPVVTVYHLPSTHPISQKLTLDQINKIGLNCNDQELITRYLQSYVGAEPRQPENLSESERQVNSAAKTKIWQLRTYCGSASNIRSLPTASNSIAQQNLPERFTERFETNTVKYDNGNVETYTRSTRVEESGLELRQVSLSEMVRPEHLRPFPIVMPKFIYNASYCTWYLDLAQYRVIACEIKPNVLQVVDKF